MNKHSINLDILRAVAALSVVFYHLSLLCKTFDPFFTIDVIRYRFPGHLCVLVFFILSGYVIGKNTKQMSNGTQIVEYLKKRLVRLVPIYVIAIIFTAFVAFGKYSFKTILSNLFFVSVPFDDVMTENGPLWSLQFEIFYYLVFIGFSYWRLDLIKSIGVTFSVIAILFFASFKMVIPPLPVSILIGFAFWLTGAALADQNTYVAWQIKGSRVMSVFLLLFSIAYFNPYAPVIKFLKLKLPDYSGYSEFHQLITYYDIYFYPLAVLLILALTRTYIKSFKFLLIFLMGFSTLVMLFIPVNYNWQYFIQKNYPIPAMLLLTSIILWAMNTNFKTSLNPLKHRIASTSDISYAIYIIHSPLIYLFGIYPAQSWFTFAIKLLLYFVTLILLSYFLEIKYQVWIKSLFFKKKTIGMSAGS